MPQAMAMNPLLISALYPLSSTTRIVALPLSGHIQADFLDSKNCRAFDSIIRAAVFVIPKT